MKKINQEQIVIPFNFYEKKEEKNWERLIRNLNEAKFLNHMKAIR